MESLRQLEGAALAAMKQLNEFVWGMPMLVLIIGTGIYLTIGLRGKTIWLIPLSLKLLLRGRRGSGDGEVSPFRALMTSLSATIGIGNIVGVATAIAIGGPGALFWMWVTAVVGSASKYAEAVLAIQYRERLADGSYGGGPMYYIRNGLGRNWRWLAVAFAVFGAIAGFGIGNMVQANSVADALRVSFDVPTWLSAVVMLTLTALVVLGGVRRIAEVSGWLVPFMTIGHLLLGLVIVLMHIDKLPGVIVQVFSDAFTGTAATGGFAGAAVFAAIQIGVARGVFSNEAGMGSAPIAHGAAQTDNAVRQGLIGSLGTFLDTIVGCSVTGFVILVTGMWEGGATGAALSTAAFSVMPGGNWLIAIAVVLFGYATILGWSYYSERCAVYLFGPRAVGPFRLLWVLAVPIGALAKLDLVWIMADNLNALMALPNLIALLLLSPVVFRLTRELLPGVVADARRR